MPQKLETGIVINKNKKEMLGSAVSGTHFGECYVNTFCGL
jgi:hypothetical protein